MKSWIFTSNSSDHSSLHSLPHTHSASSSSAPPSRHHGLSEMMAEESINYARCIIKKWRVDAGKFERDSVSTLFFADRKEAVKLLNATIGLHHAMNCYVKLNATSEKLVDAQDLMQIAMTRLKFEFYTILSANRKNLDSNSVSSRSSINISEFINEDQEKLATNLPEPMSEAEIAVEDLKMIAECMIACGYVKECINIYQIVRKSIVDETLCDLGIERLSIAQLRKMEWVILENRIKRWLHAVKLAVQTLFCREKILCDAVFSSSKKISLACFVEICRDAAVELFAFAEHVCKSKKVLSPEKVFRLLDLYKAINDVWPDIEFIFSDKLSAVVRLQATAAQKKLSETVRAMIGKFEDAIHKELSKPPPGGGVHPLTRYVMNFLIFLGDYSAAVTGILDDWPVKYYFPNPSSGSESDTSTTEISRRLAWLILVLLCKLDSKVSAYDDVALSYLFLANNLNYVVSKVRNSDLGILIGDDWIRKHELKVKTYLANFERHGWSNVISAVPANPTAALPLPKVSECFEEFYVSFEQACKKQSSWVIPDPKLREEVKISLAKRIVSGYRVCYGQSRVVGLIVRYTPEDLYNCLSNLFSAAAGKSYTTSLREIGKP